MLHLDNRSIYGENTTVINDYSNYNFDGVVAGGPVFNWTSAMLGGAYRFPAAGNISFGDQDALIGFNKTYMFWVLPETVSGTQTLIDKLNTGASTGLRIDATASETGGKANIAVTSDSQIITVTDILTQNKYTHVAVTIDTTGSAIIYKDGILHTTGSFTSMNANNIIFILGQTSSLTQSFTGLLDEFVIVNKTLSANEVQDAARLPSGTYYWNVNATDGSLYNSSVTWELIVNLSSVPTITLNYPPNNTNFVDIAGGMLGNITLNATVNDPIASDLLTVEFYGRNATAPTLENLLFRQENVAVNTTVQYNWTSMPVQNQSNLLMLLHFDNMASYGENSSYVYDFTGFGNNGTVPPGALGSAVINGTSGKFGGGFFSNSSNENDRMLFTDKDDIIDFKGDKTYTAWVKPLDYPTNALGRGIISKLSTLLNAHSGFQIGQYDTSLEIRSNGTAYIIRIPNFFAGKAGQFVHIAVVLLENTTMDTYKDGILYNTTTLPMPGFNNNQLTIGRQSAGTGGTLKAFNGTIDEVAIFNRSLSSNEILDLYRLRGGTYFWYGNVSDGRSVNSSETRMFTITRNNAPSLSGVSIGPISANTTDTLNCTFTVSDQDAGDTLTANVSFYNSTLFVAVYNISVTNSVLASQVLTTGLQAHYENWTCGIITFDGAITGSPVNSSQITIVNSIPSIPTLVTPADNNVTINTKPFFNWTSKDADNDPINYTVNITCLTTAGAFCGVGEDNRLINLTSLAQGIDGSATGNYTTADDFDFFLDDGFRYNWTVMATDGANSSAFAQPRNITFIVVVDINLSRISIDFGSLGLNANDDTADGSPLPIKIDNIGNAFVNVTISANNFLFTTQSAASNYYRFRVNDSVSGGQAVVPFSSTSQTTFAQMTNTNISAIVKFNETATANIDINITVPPDEPQGLKSSQIFLNAVYPGR